MQYVGIQTQQSRNNLRSAFLLFLFPCLVAALLY
ncbi:protease, partial [Bacteroides ovatus]